MAMRTLELEQRESGTAAIPVRCHREASKPRCELAAARSARALVSCWCAYERRWVQASNAAHERAPASSKQRAPATAHHVEAYLVDDAFEFELANFHALVTHNVASESALERPRRSLESRVREWGAALDHRVRMWWQPREQDAALASLADLQLVVPGIWIGSALTLQHADAIVRKKIAHVVYCATAEPQQQQPNRIAQLPASPFPSTFAYAITLSETPRQAHLDQMRAAMKSGAATHSTWHELDAASKFLLGITRLHDRFAAASRVDVTSSASDSSNDNDSNDSGDSSERAVPSSAEMGLLIYCDSGVSTSVAVCAALLMYRFCLPLELAMLLLRTARRFVAPSPYLYRQLELYDRALQTRREGTRLPLQRLPA